VRMPSKRKRDCGSTTSTVASKTTCSYPLIVNGPRSVEPGAITLDILPRTTDQTRLDRSERATHVPGEPSGESAFQCGRCCSDSMASSYSLSG
jgi:hypothetical protein